MAIPDLQEEWRDLIGYEGLYKVSNLGKVFSNFLGRPMKLQTNQRTGQIMVNLKDSDGVEKRVLVGRLILETFDKPCPPGMEACHGPNGQTDNSITNLSWDTHVNNTRRDRARDGTQVKGETHGIHKVTEDEVREIRRLRAAGCSMVALESRYPISLQAISNIINRRTWAHVGDT